MFSTVAVEQIINGRRQARPSTPPAITNPHLQIMLQGKMLPAVAMGSFYQVMLPPGASEIRIVSHRFVPAHGHKWFGVPVAALILDGQELALDDDRLTDGWHPAEDHWRWTIGNAGLVIAGASSLSLTLAPQSHRLRGAAD